MKRRYANASIVVFWDSEKCIYSGRCTGQLPRVFDAARRPWVDVNAADAGEIKRVIDTCPSGALSYRVPGRRKSRSVQIEVLKNGPYKVSGTCHLLDTEGRLLEAGDSFALCRCGASQKTPFCDGTHYSLGWCDENGKAPVHQDISPNPGV